ncbi:MAG: hypothetical protein EON86_15905, partial [Brevundimonas sp.]
MTQTRLLKSAAMALVLAAGAPVAAFATPMLQKAVPDRVQRLPDGVIVVPTSGEARAVRLQVYGPRTIRVTASPDDSFEA